MPNIRPVMITGAKGRLAQVLAGELNAYGHGVTSVSRGELDICDAEQIAAAVRRIRPAVIVNCAAYNAVDAAEQDAVSAFAVNASGPTLLAAAAKTAGALLIHYGTDFVFDGEASSPYSETAPTNPLSRYGASKLIGEGAVGALDRHYVLRIASLFGAPGNRSTVDAMIDGVRGGAAVSAFSDRTVTPSYAPDVARATRLLIERTPAPGTYHCVNSGTTTWFHLAREIAVQLGGRAQIVAVEARQVTGAAARPVFCALSNAKLSSAGIQMPSWQCAIARHLRARRLTPDVQTLSASF